MNMNDHDQLVGRGLEKEMLHVTEEDVNLTATMVVIAETIVMNLQFTSDTLAVKTRPSEDIIESHWLTVWVMLVICCQKRMRLHTSNNTEFVLLDHIF